MTENEEPVLLQHCKVIYDGMLEQAEEPVDETKPREWRGMLTKLFVRLDYGTSNYSRIVNMLRSMGCIEQVRRGAGKVDSVWLLWQPPSLELFEWVKEQELYGGDREETSPQESSVEQRLRDLNTMMLNMRDQIANMQEQVDVLWDDMMEGKDAED